MTMMMSNGHVDNGVNVEALLGARAALTAAPEAARFQWRATAGAMTVNPSKPGVGL